MLLPDKPITGRLQTWANLEWKDNPYGTFQWT